MGTCLTGASYVVFETDLRWMAVCWTNDQTPRVLATSFDRASIADVMEAIRHSLPDVSLDLTDISDAPILLRDIVHRLERFASGDMLADFRDVPLDLRSKTPFQRTVLRRCQQIRPGTTVSYGELAAMADSPKAARAVGSVMSSNRLPLIVPCHRVVGGDGKLHGFSSPSGVNMKERLLALERNAAAALA